MSEISIGKVPAMENQCVAQFCRWCLKVGSELRRPDAPTGQVSTYVQEIPMRQKWLPVRQLCLWAQKPHSPTVQIFCFRGAANHKRVIKKRGAKTSRFSRWMNCQASPRPRITSVSPAGWLLPSTCSANFSFVICSNYGGSRRRKDNFTDTEIGK